MDQSEAHRLEEEAFSSAMRQCRPHLMFVILFSAAMHLLFLAPSLYMMQVYDRVLATGGLMTLVFLSLILVACLATLALMDAVRGRLMSVAGQRVDRILAPVVMTAAMKRSGRKAAGDRQTVRDFDLARSAFSGPAALAVIDLPWTPLYIGVCFLIHPVIGGLALAGGVLIFGLAYLNFQQLKKPMAAQEETASTAYAVQHADGLNLDAAQALGMRKALVKRQLLARRQSTLAQGDATRLNATFAAITKFARLALQSAALGTGAYLAVQQEISAGAIIACTILVSRAFAPLEQVVGAWRQLTQGVRGLRTVREVLRADKVDAQHTELPAPKGILMVENVNFEAPGGERLLLEDISFVVKPGEIVGVVGPSGAGKSTLMRVVAGASDPSGGAVRIDGAKLSDWDSDRLGKHIGYLPQEVSLFAGSVSQNISRFERLDGSEGAEIDEAIVKAAQTAGAHDMILRLPHAYDTVLGAGGKGVSAGQAQRIALARSLYNSPALLILDEPNAHLDAEGEGALISALKAAKARGAATLVVAHRAGFMGVVDKLLLLKDGRVSMFGPRDEVLDKLNRPRPGSPAPVSRAQAKPGARA